MKYIYIGFLLLFGCSSNNKSLSSLPKLTKLSYHEIKVDAIENSFMEYEELVFVDSLEGTLDRHFVKQIIIENPGKYFIQPFQDSLGNIKYAKVQLASREDKMFMAEMNRILNEDPDVFVKVVDCSRMKDILSDILVTDSTDRFSLNRQKRDSIDRLNLTSVISIIENCGVPNIEDAGEEGILAIFLTLQHSSYRYMKQYLYVIEKFVNLGELSRKQLVIMEDRILMYEGLPQKYGSQLIGEELYEVDNMDSVFNRRKKLGMISLKEYLDSIIIKK